MTEKRFYYNIFYYPNTNKIMEYEIIDRESFPNYPNHDEVEGIPNWCIYIGENDSNWQNMCIDKLNELHEEKEDWKNNCLKTVSENSILWNEISILTEQGANPSNAFEGYLNNLKKRNKKLQGDLNE